MGIPLWVKLVKARDLLVCARVNLTFCATVVAGELSMCRKRDALLVVVNVLNLGYPDKKMRRYNWSLKSIRRHHQGTGRFVF